MLCHCPAGNVNEKGMLLLFTALEVILQCFPQDGPAFLTPALQRLLVLLLANTESGLTMSSESTVAEAEISCRADQIFAQTHQRLQVAHQSCNMSHAFCCMFT